MDEVKEDEEEVVIYGHNYCECGFEFIDGFWVWFETEVCKE